MWGDGDRVTIERNEAARTHEGNPATRKRVGVDGALALQPSFLYGFDQFFGSLAATSGRHLVAEFGTWNGATLEDDVVRRQAAGPGPGEGLRQLNRRRQQDATVEVEGLLPLARRSFDELTIENGRPPGRLLLGRRMAEAGSDVPVRRLVALIAELRGRTAANRPSRTRASRRAL
jgi:hypothetical protein